MRKATNREPLGSFFFKSGMLMASAITANLISLAGYALLARVYSMQLIGEYFSVVAIASVISVLVHVGLAQAVPLMSDEEVKVGVTLLSYISLCMLCLGLFMILVETKLAFILFAASILSLSVLLESMLIRDGRVRKIAIFRVALPMSSFALVLLMGVTFNPSVYLIVGGYFVGMAIVVIGYFVRLAYPLLVRVTVTDAMEFLKSYSNFPRFIGPGVFFHTAAYNLPSIIGLHYFGGIAVAAYNLAYRFVMAPMTIVGKAIGQAYTSHLSFAYRNDDRLAIGFRLDAVLVLFASLVSIGIFFVFPPIARVVFPENHADISAYAIALIPMAFSMLTVSPLSNILQFTENQRMIFLMHAASFIGSALSLGLAVYLDNFIVGVAVFSVFILLRYIWLYFEILATRRSESH